MNAEASTFELFGNGRIASSAFGDNNMVCGRAIGPAGGSMSGDFACDVGDAGTQFDPCVTHGTFG
jgi:hypothetical protein